MKKTFEKELAELINRHSLENGSETPDFILANFLVFALSAFHIAALDREKWYGRTAFNSDASPGFVNPEEFAAAIVDKEEIAALKVQLTEARAFARRLVCCNDSEDAELSEIVCTISEWPDERVEKKEKARRKPAQRRSGKERRGRLTWSPKS